MDILDDILECSVCLKPLDDNNKALPCQHTFCRPCLEAIVRSQKELRCPECRVLINKKIDDLPPNVLLIRLLDGLKQQKKLLNNSNGNNKTGTQKRHSVEGILSDCSRNDDKLKVNNHQHERMHSNPETLIQITRPVVDKKVPLASTVFPYSSNMQGDLKLSVGDKVELLRWVDDNWLYGKLVNDENKCGMFPANHVKILVPLPQEEKPLCKTLFSFKSKDKGEDRDCLIFNKGDTIQVLRRVDENWGEGLLDDQIGIFPLSFVKMNKSARNLIEEMSSPSTAYITSQNNNVMTSQQQEKRTSSSGIFGAAARRIKSKKIITSQSTSGKSQSRHSFPLFRSSAMTSPNADNVMTSPNNSATKGETSTSQNVKMRNKNNNNRKNLSNQGENGDKATGKSNSYDSPSTKIRTSILTGSLFNPPTSKSDISHRCDIPSTSRINKFQRQYSKSPPLSPTYKLQIHARTNQQSSNFHGNSPNSQQHFHGNSPKPPPRPPQPNFTRESPYNKTNVKNMESRWPNFRGRSISPPNRRDVFSTNGNEERMFPANQNKGNNKNVKFRIRSKSAANNRRIKLDKIFKTSEKSNPVAQSTSNSSRKKENLDNRYVATMRYPATGPGELSLNPSDVIIVHEIRADGWLRGRHEKSGKIGHVPGTFVEKCKK